MLFIRPINFHFVSNTSRWRRINKIQVSFCVDAVHSTLCTCIVILYCKIYSSPFSVAIIEHMNLQFCHFIIYIVALLRINWVNSDKYKSHKTTTIQGWHWMSVEKSKNRIDFAHWPAVCVITHLTAMQGERKNVGWVRVERESVCLNYTFRLLALIACHHHEISICSKRAIPYWFHMFQRNTISAFIMMCRRCHMTSFFFSCGNWSHKPQTLSNPNFNSCKLCVCVCVIGQKCGLWMAGTHNVYVTL